MIRREALSGGFADPVFDSQAVFRGVLDALSRPGRIVDIGARVEPPPPLAPVAAAVLSALCDEGTPVFLDDTLARHEAIPAWISFHTGVPIVAEPAEAAFAVIGDPLAMPPFAAFRQGTAEYPDRSTTLILQLAAFDGASKLTLTGPGIADEASLAPAPLPPDFIDRMRRNRALFPRGVDLLLTAGNRLAALPRPVRIAEGAR
jgi:alpha-D-ribose 1-methylphosphonate 5-triphosphate synthase subunit PhnH